ncbi:MAG: 1-acyl-sn-glycerol-3-phosphate acyltransferase, partial [Burkholderiales bacterium]|nr:1-acyl-sn-glycerol-3-phosphate acyltransferase [Burkholderiales bacterium]
IAIDRRAGRRALREMLEQGRDRLAQGFWIVVFPEGTRVPPGSRVPYQIGGAWLASKTDASVVPVAHNAGTLWAKGAFLKYPGTITVSIGPAIDPSGLTPDALNTRVESWIENEVARLGTART